MLYGVLKDVNVNTGADSELQYVFAAPTKVLSNQPAFVQDMMNLGRRASSQGVQRWEIETNVHPENNSGNFLTHSVRFGSNGVFGIRMPQVAFLKNENLNSGIVTVDAFAGAINLSTSIYLEPGQFIQFKSGSTLYPKVHLVVECTGSGSYSTVISPPLTRNISHNDLIITGGAVTMLAYYDTSTMKGIVYTDGILSDPGSVKFIEAIE